jgi:hypothetical protein
MPPEVTDIDSSWDDDTMPRFELDDPMSESAFDRVTAIPELPPEAFAKQVMADQQGEATGPDPLPHLPSEPPTLDVMPLDPMGLEQAPRPGRALSHAELAAQQAASNLTPTTRPGRPRGPLGIQPTGLELAEVSPEPPATARSALSGEFGFGHDPRDPVLELDLGEVARSGPPPAVLMPSPPASPRDGEITEMKDRYAMGDFTGALIVAEGLLEANADDIDAQRYAQSCRDVLTQMYTARIGALSQRVSVAVPGDQIRWLSLDHRAGFVLSLIDGSSTVEELLDISGMNRLDALRIIYTLFDQRVIALS